MFKLQAIYPLMRIVGMLGWIRLGLRRRIVSFVCPISTGTDLSFDVTNGKVRYRGNIRTAQEWHVYFFGGYELKEAALIEDILTRLEKPVVFDIGANLGAHALSMSSRAKVVHAFEPFEPLANRLEGQVILNGFDNIKVHRFGLGADDEELTYYLDESSSNSGTGSFLPEHSGDSAAGNLMVRRGDSWSKDIRPDFIKIDVEGYEAIALKGLTKTLAAGRPLILMEVTESSSRVFSKFGGLENVIPYDFESYEIKNPLAIMGLFQAGRYRLEQTSVISPRHASYNVLIVPLERRELIKSLKGARA